MPFIIPATDLPKVDITQATPRIVPIGFPRNAILTRRGDNEAINWTAPISPFRLTGFSKNFINPSIADPARNEDTFNINLPTAANVLARRAMASGFLANQVNAANPTAAFSKNVENLTNPENRLPNDFLVFSLNSLPINLNNPGFSELSS